MVGLLPFEYAERWRNDRDAETVHRHIKMRGADKNVVTALTAPLLLKYGYLGRNETSKW